MSLLTETVTTISDTEFLSTTGFLADENQVGVYVTQGLFIAESTTVPTPGTPMTGGGLLFVDGGALKYQGTSGTVTTIAAS
jgi:hypothetical protein